jgi:hypothetical protein
LSLPIFIKTNARSKNIFVTADFHESSRLLENFLATVPIFIKTNAHSKNFFVTAYFHENSRLLEKFFKRKPVPKFAKENCLAANTNVREGRIRCPHKTVLTISISKSASFLPI